MLKKSVIILAGMLLLITSCFANTRMQQSAKQQAIPKVKEVTIMDFSQEKENVIYLAGGCFWGLEKLMQSIPGVIDAQSGYANGTGKADAKYQTILGGKTGFRETVRVEYDPAKVSLDHLLLAYFYVIDPTVLNKQGNDTGTQYQTGIYYTNTQAQAVVERIVELERGRHKVFAVEVGPLKNYYPAEEYHQNYLDKNPGGYCHISPAKIKLLSTLKIDAGAYKKPAAETIRDKLTAEQFQVTQQNGTERPFHNEFGINLPKAFMLISSPANRSFLQPTNIRAAAAGPPLQSPSRAPLGGKGGFEPRDAPHGGQKPRRRLPSRSCVHRRSGVAQRRALLHQQRGPALRPL